MIQLFELKKIIKIHSPGSVIQSDTNPITADIRGALSQEVNILIPLCLPLALPRGAELFEAKVKKLIAARLELEQKSVETLKKQ